MVPSCFLESIYDIAFAQKKTAKNSFKMAMYELYNNIFLLSLYISRALFNWQNNPQANLSK